MKGSASSSHFDRIHRAFLLHANEEISFLAQVIQALCKEARLGLALRAKENNYLLEYPNPALVEIRQLTPWMLPLFEQLGAWIKGESVTCLFEEIDEGKVIMEKASSPPATMSWVSFQIENPLLIQTILWVAVPDEAEKSKLDLALLAEGVRSIENSLRTKEQVSLLQNEVVKLQREKAQVESLLAAFPDLLFLLDEQGTIQSVRAGNAEDLVQPAALLRGQNIQDIPGLSSGTYTKFLEAVRAIQAGETHALFEYTTLKDHETQYFEANMAPFGESQFIAIVRNITEVKKIEADLFTSSKLFEQAGKLAKIGAWEYDCVKHTHHWSQVTREILGYDAHAPEPTVEVGMRLYEDEESFRLINASFRLAVEEGIPYDVELRLKTYKNETIWVRALGIPVMEDGICQRIFGTFQDISAIKKSQEELALKVEEFRALFENMGQGVVYHDQTGAIIRANSAAQDILGLNLETLLNSSSIDPRWHIITEDGVPYRESNIPPCVP
ncbi:signal-transducing histidine kinase [Nitritalea halalkaliphila LW7]|uniref:histidine kinase n=1 Tax=Nitritalea halalkaliphila LW7 TaxID=1189621 RepID=I5CAJ4_9BACT|nr:PAS domain S-box protein [Nitritalea halalkaliphila]EIM78846.1 signal-transducing histidine kinase [Nitritalea halalkaliphila LW7]